MVTLLPIPVGVNVTADHCTKYKNTRCINKGGIDRHAGSVKSVSERIFTCSACYLYESCTFYFQALDLSMLSILIAQNFEL